MSKAYAVFVHHDKGRALIVVEARNKKVAVQMVMKAENCPRRAIKSIELIKERKKK